MILEVRVSNISSSNHDCLILGPEKDRENMENTLDTVKKLKHLHGILILLKPNNSRLTVIFRFVIQELLTHLHRDAAKNIVFGFTNTRSTNYMPG